MTTLHSKLTHLPLDKMAAISAHNNFKCIFLNENDSIPIRIDCTEICSQETSWQYASIGSGNGLKPNRRQAITWTNADPVHWHIYAALGGDNTFFIVSVNWYFPGAAVIL